LSKIVRQQSVLVSKALRREVVGGLGQGRPGICRQKPDQGTTSRFCNSRTFTTLWFRVRFRTNRVMTLTCWKAATGARRSAVHLRTRNRIFEQYSVSTKPHVCARAESFRASDEPVPLHSDPGRLSMFRPWLGEVAIAYGLGPRCEPCGGAEARRILTQIRAGDARETRRWFGGACRPRNTRRPSRLCKAP
jgi:hypothetical protein